MSRFAQITCLAAVAFAFIGAVAPAAVAEGAVCGPRGAIVDRLENVYGESRLGLGVGRENGVVEVYTSAATGSWTILLTLPTGVTCLVAAGEAWEEMADAVPAGEGA